MNVMALLEYLDEELSKSATVPLTGKRLVDVCSMYQPQNPRIPEWHQGRSPDGKRHKK